MTKGIHKAKLKDKIIMGIDQLKLNIFKKEWTPESKDSEFCCIVCGMIHRHIMSFDSSQNPSMIKLKGNKTAKKLYTLDFCSSKCANKYSEHKQIHLFDLDKLHQHLDSGFWRKRWIEYYNWKYNIKN